MDNFTDKEVIDASGSPLAFFLRLESWKRTIAVQILSNINPDASSRYDEEKLFDYEMIVHFSGDTIPKSDPDTFEPLHICDDMECARCEADRTKIDTYVYRCNQLLTALENSPDNVEFATPKFWIKFAMQCDLKPAWLDDAEKYALIDLKDETDGSKDKIVAKRPLPIGEKRIDVMIQVALELNYEPTKIPYRGKKNIKDYCLENFPKLFTFDTFDAAWKKRGDSLRVENHEQYASRQIN